MSTKPASAGLKPDQSKSQTSPINLANSGRGQSSGTDATASSTVDTVAVLALGEAGEILAARDACYAVFGWEPLALVGQNVRILLKRGLDNEVGRFLHRHREGKNPAGTSELEVKAVRRDGIEFPAQVTTLTWSWETKFIKKSDTSRLCWTAAFRDARTLPKPAETTAATPTPTAAPQPVAATAATETETAATVPSDQPPAKVESKSTPPESAASTPTAPSEAPASPADSKPTAELTTAAVAELPSASTAGDVKNESTATKDSASPPDDSASVVLKATDLQSQLVEAQAAAQRAEAALLEEIAQREKLEERLQNLSHSLRLEQAERSKRFEEDLSRLRQERDELNTKLAVEQQVASESSQRAEELEGRLGRNEADFEQAKTTLDQEAADRARAEASWRQQLDTACIAKKELEGAWAGAVECNKRFEEELSTLRREHDELKRKLTAEQQAAAESQSRAKEVASRLSRNAAAADRALADLEKENTERQRADAEWREQLEAARALKSRLESTVAETTDRNRRLERDLAGLQQEHDSLQSRMVAEQQLAHESSRRAEDLDARLSEAAADVASLRRALEESDSKLKEARQSAVEAAERTENLQRRADDDAADLDRLANELAEQTAEREQIEDRAREQQEAAKAQARKLEADWATSLERNVRYEEELAELRRHRDELTQQLETHQRADDNTTHRVTDLERRLERATSELKRVAAESERRHTEREQADAEWREQLAAAKALAKKLDTAWTGATERLRRLEEEAVVLRKERESLQTRLAGAQQQAADSRRRTSTVDRSSPRSTTPAARPPRESQKPAPRHPGQVQQYSFDPPGDAAKLRNAKNGSSNGSHSP